MCPPRASLVLAALLVPASAGAQIVNTLRGFEAREPGWSGGLEGTVAAADGNTDYLEWELGGAVQHLVGRSRWRLLGRWMDRRSEGKSLAKDRMLHLRHNWRFTPTVASVAFVQGAHNPFQRLETRLLVGVGTRLDLLQGDAWKGAIGLAAMYQDEEIGPLPGDAPPETPDDSGRQRESRASAFLSLYSTSSEQIETDLVVFWQPRWSDVTDARIFVTASLRVDVTAGLYVLLRYRLNWDTEPPIAVLERDQAIRGGLGLEF